MSLGSGSLEGWSRLRLGNGLDRGLGADRRDRRGRLVGVFMIVMIAFVLAAVGIIVSVMVLVIAGMTMFVMIMVAMIVVAMIVALVLAVMLAIGVQMLALGMLRQRGAVDRLGGGIGAGFETFDDVAAHALAMTAAAGIAVPRAATAVRAVLALFLGLAMGLFLGLDQRLPVCDRDLVVVGMDFAEGEKAVAIAAILDEGGLERGFDPCDLGEVDIPAQLLALRSLEIKLFDAIAADHDDPGLLRVGGIDQHLVGHVLTLGGGGRDKPWARIAPAGDATVHLIRG
ncbi:hypothetical protein [Bradyrhizobium yuanmingense]|uniref:hypothetical protein n=1 Tax=Bradyrhizobium yuanmingense TaxID=108015 RepID=UPI0023BA15E9|nr:hypothetical protein [Bradyrhizobium yuanmingense]MDF0581088.1 hypothetical protein [Bradyrhizobium yuanmingense]